MTTTTNSISPSDRLVAALAALHDIDAKRAGVTPTDAAMLALGHAGIRVRPSDTPALPPARTEAVAEAVAAIDELIAIETEHLEPLNAEIVRLQSVFDQAEAEHKRTTEALTEARAHLQNHHSAMSHPRLRLKKLVRFRTKLTTEP